MLNLSNFLNFIATGVYFIQDCSLHDDFCLYTNGSTASNVDDGENICSIDGGILLNLFIDTNYSLQSSTQAFIEKYSELIDGNKAVLYRNDSYTINSTNNCSHYNLWKVGGCSNELQFLVICLKKNCTYQWETYSNKTNSFDGFMLATLPLKICKLFCELEIEKCGGYSWNRLNNECELFNGTLDDQYTNLVFEAHVDYYEISPERYTCHNRTDYYILEKREDQDNIMKIIGVIVLLTLAFCLVEICVPPPKYNKMKVGQPRSNLFSKFYITPLPRDRLGNDESSSLYV